MGSWPSAHPPAGPVRIVETQRPPSTQRTSQRCEAIAIIEWATQTLRSSDYRRNYHQTGLALNVGFLRRRVGSGFKGVATELDNLEVCTTRSKMR